MKKLLSLSLFTAYSAVSMAQLPVSTTVENKNAVLEEFTGIYCVYCPDGHKRAQAFHDANPSDVVLINIHSGGYAAPGTGDPDFRTQWGAAIDNQSGLVGYPAGTINRRVFAGMQQGSGTAMSRGDWATAGATVIGESSYANIAIEGDIDYVANTLTVTVETYFTSAAPSGTVKLNVAVMQSGIEGPQTGMSANPAQVLPNGNYIHNHMLRDLLTGQWGVDIPTTTGVVNTYSYVWNIPNNINGVPVSLGDLEIAAFIAETQQNIVTGANGPVTFTLPAGVNTADVEAVNSFTVPAEYCATDVTPEFTIKNNESFALDSVEAILDFNGTKVSQWVTNVPANGTQVVTFPTQTLISGTNTMGYEVSVSNVFKYLDVSSGNNIVTGDPAYMVNPVVNNAPLTAEFEMDATMAPPSGFISTDASNTLVVDKNNVQNFNTPLGGYQQSEKSVMFYFPNMNPSNVASIISEKVSLVGGHHSEVEFDYSYAVRGSVTGDQLNVYMSNNCGDTWVRIFDGTGGSGLETAPATGAQNLFFPTSPSHWKTISAYISGEDGTAELMLKFEGISAGGNMLFVDNIMVDGKPIGIKEVATETASVYPNPATDKFFIELEEPTNFSAQLTTVTGQVVKTAEYTKTAKAEMTTDGLAKGVYILNISSDKGTSSQRVTIAD